MKSFIKNPEACAVAGHPVLLNLIYSWGNEGWSALDEYLATCINHALAADGPVLECGSGLSTLLLGAVAQKKGHYYWALEHTAAWGTKLQTYLDAYNLDAVVLCVKPLKDFGEYSWYDAPLASMPDNFSLAICDGPPGTTKGGRYGLVPIMKARFGPRCVILLDDAIREEEVASAARWKTELGAELEMLGSAKPYIKLTLQNRAEAA